MSFKMPPREKVHEALSAIVDNRVIIDENSNSAEVTSSNHTKKYLVEWNDNTYSSNDNASYYQGYLGYPIITVLLIQGKISYNEKILEYFKDINWKEINTKFNNDYTKAVESVYEDLRKQGVDIDFIDREINNMYESLRNLNIAIKKSKLMPPK